jgi:RpiR family carbohydrate utilization transcriptional regulator
MTAVSLSLRKVAVPRGGLPGDGDVPVIARLATLAPSLRESEQRIADYVLANPAELPYLTVSDLADRTGTSEATVIRWSQRLGFSGYSALKIALALELRAGSDGAARTNEQPTDLGTIKRTVVDLNVESLRDALQLLDEAELARAVDALVRARRIEVYAVGGTAIVAQDAAFTLMQMGLRIVAVTDPHLQVMSAVQLGPEDVALGVSLSGSTRDTVEALQAARDAGATCICITRHPGSPITRAADVTLLAPARPASIGGHQLYGRAAQLAVVDLLAAAVVAARPEASLRAIERGRQVLDTKRLT